MGNYPSERWSRATAVPVGALVSCGAVLLGCSLVSGCTLARSGLGEAASSVEDAGWSSRDPEDAGVAGSEGGRPVGRDPTEGGPLDAGSPDGGRGASDGGPRSRDASMPDGEVDGDADDSSGEDAGPPDAGAPDAGQPDAGSTDAGPPDAGVPGCDVRIYQGHRYSFCDRSDPFAVARDACAAHGGSLVGVDDDAENTWITNQAADIRGQTGGQWWIGYTDARIEGAWEWVDGALRVYTHWHLPNGRPAYFGEPSGGSSENCATILRFGVDDGFGYGPSDWNDESCNTSLPFVCESM